MQRMLSLVVYPLIAMAVLGLALVGCAGTTTSGRTSVTPADALAKVQAGAAYLDGVLAKVQTAVATAKAQLPAKAAAIEAKIGPALATLQMLVGSYDTAVAAQDAGTADNMWSVVRTAVTTALEVGAEVLGPSLLSGLLGA